MYLFFCFDESIEKRGIKGKIDIPTRLASQINPHPIPLCSKILLKKGKTVPERGLYQNS